MNKAILSVSVLTASVLAASCGGGGGGGKGGVGVTQVDVTPVVTDPNPPSYPSASTLSLKVVDASQKMPVSGASVQITGALVSNGSQAGVTDANGEITLDLDQTVFTDNNDDGFPDLPEDVDISISGTGILSTSDTATVDAYGASRFDIDVVKLDPSDLPDGVKMESRATDLTTAERTTNDAGIAVVKIEPVASAGPAAAVEIPVDIKLVSKSGVAIDPAQLKVELVSFDVSNETASRLMPGGNVPSISNPGVLAAAAGKNVEESASVILESIGFVALELGDGTNTASNVVTEQPVKVSVPVTALKPNPQTGLPTKAGDEVLVWSMSKGDTAWRFEGKKAIVVDASGSLKVDVETNHFSYFNLAYAKFDERCTSSIAVVNDQGQKLATKGTFAISNESFSFTDTYDGDGVLTLADVPKAPVNVTFTPEAGSPVGLIGVKTTVTLAAGGALSNDGEAPKIKLMDPCDSSGGRIAFQSLAKPVPVVNIVAANLSVTEGNSGSITVELFDAPADGAPVQVTLNVRPAPGSWSPAVADADYVAITNQVITLDKSNPFKIIPVDTIGDADIETRYKYFEAVLSNPSNGAILNQGATSLTRWGQIQDDDQIALVGVIPSASEASGKAVVQFQLDRPLPADMKSGLWVGVVAKSAGADTANGILDYQDTRSRYADYSGNIAAYDSYKSVYFAPGSQTATLEIPVYDDLDVEGAETFSLSFPYASGALYLGTYQSTPVSVAIVDNDVTTAAPASYTLQSVPAPAEIREGDLVFFKVVLNTATDTPVNIAFSAPTNSLYKFSTDGVNSVASGTLTFAAGEATRYLAMTAPRNGIVTGDANPAISFTPTAGITGPATLGMTVVDSDYDYLYINSGFTETRGNEGQLKTVNLYNQVSTSMSGASTQLNFTVDSASTATSGQDFTQSGSGTYTINGSGSQVLGFQIIDDQVPETSEKLVVQTGIASITGTSAKWLFTASDSDHGSCRWGIFNPTPGQISACTSTATLIIGNDDVTTFALKPAPLVELKAVNAEDFPAYVVNIDLVSDGIPSGFSGDIYFDVTLDGVAQAQAKLSKSHPNGKVTVQLPLTTQQSLINSGILTGTSDLSGTAQRLVTVSIADSSRLALEAEGINWTFPNRTVGISVTYTKSIVTGATGGTGSGQ